ncbi:MAG: hypothetical protein RR246_02540 [Clostridia bacterium]
MKKINAFDLLVICFLITATVAGTVFAAKQITTASDHALITLLICENITESAPFLKVGDTLFFLDGSEIGTVSALKSRSNGIAVTVNATIKDDMLIGKTKMKLGKTYSFFTKRILGDAECTGIVKVKG